MTKRYLGKKETISKRRIKMPEYDPPNAFYTQIDLPKYIKPEVFIGKEGCHLKHMTELSKCDYLWYDFKRGVIEVWGKEHRLPKALRMLKKRIDSFDPPLPKGPHPNRRYPPSEYNPEVHKNITVTSWEEYPRTIIYEMIGPEPDVMKFYFEILSVYPHNPYFTGIQSKEPNGDGIKLIVKRSSTSD
jgi:hypothetical protein